VLIIPETTTADHTHSKNGVNSGHAKFGADNNREALIVELPCGSLKLYWHQSQGQPYRAGRLLIV
jgi:hypothetical protein